MQVEEPVQGPSHSGGVRALVSMELSASNKRLDLALAYFDAEEPQPLALTLAEPPHADGRRRARRLFCRRRLLHCPWIMIHQCTRSRGEFASPLRAEKYQNGRAVEIASNGFLNLGFIGSSATNTRSVGLRVKPIQLLEGRVDPTMAGVWPRKLKAREAIAYFQYSDANGGQWRAIGRPRQTQAPIGRVFFANA